MGVEGSISSEDLSGGTHISSVLGLAEGGGFDPTRTVQPRNFSRRSLSFSSHAPRAQLYPQEYPREALHCTPRALRPSSHALCDRSGREFNPTLTDWSSQQAPFR